MSEQKKETLEFLNSERENLIGRLDYIKERWITKRKIFKVLILSGLITVFFITINYSMSRKLTPLSVISISMLTSTLYCTIRDYARDKVEYELELQKIDLRLSALDKIERELD